MYEGFETKGREGLDKYKNGWEIEIEIGQASKSINNIILRFDDTGCQVVEVRRTRSKVWEIQGEAL